jgi:hypothetical protein
VGFQEERALALDPLFVNIPTNSAEALGCGGSQPKKEKLLQCNRFPAAQTAENPRPPLSKQSCGLRIWQGFAGSSAPRVRCAGYRRRGRWVDPFGSHTGALAGSQHSFAGPTIQTRLTGRLAVSLSLAFRLDHLRSAQRLAGGPSILALSAHCQVPSSFNSTPGHPICQVAIVGCSALRTCSSLMFDVVRRWNISKKVTVALRL